MIGPQFDTRPDERVHALAGHEARNRRDERAVGRETEASPGGGLLGGGLRPEAFDVDTGRHDRARRQRSAERSLALGSRIAAGCDHSGRTGEHTVEQTTGTGHTAGNRDLRTVQNDAVGPIEVGADQAGGNGRIDDDDLGVVGLGELIDSSNEHRLWQQPGFALRTTVKSCAASQASAPSCGVVCTMTSSAGRRRHSSQR